MVDDRVMGGNERNSGCGYRERTSVCTAQFFGLYLLTLPLGTLLLRLLPPSSDMYILQSFPTLTLLQQHPHLLPH